MNQLAPVDQQQPANDAPTKLAMRSGGAVQALVPTSFEDVFRLGRVVAASGLAPKDMDTPETVTIAIMHGLEIGLPPMQALQRIAVINGRPTIWGDAAIALVRASGKAKSIKEYYEGEGDDRVAICLVVRKDDPDSPIEGRFSVADAKTAKLWGKTGYNGKPTPWVTHPDRMLKMRARAFALRDGFADVLGGMYLAEEEQDVERQEAPTTSSPMPTIPDIPDEPAIDVVLNAPTQEPAEAETVVEVAKVHDPREDKPQGRSKQPYAEMGQPAAEHSPEKIIDVDDVEDLVTRLGSAPDVDILEEVRAEAQGIWDDLFPPDRDDLQKAYDERREALGG